MASLLSNLISRRPSGTSSDNAFPESEPLLLPEHRVRLTRDLRSFRLDLMARDKMTKLGRLWNDFTEFLDTGPVADLGVGLALGSAFSSVINRHVDLVDLNAFLSVTFENSELLFIDLLSVVKNDEDFVRKWKDLAHDLLTNANNCLYPQLCRGHFSATSRPYLSRNRCQFLLSSQTRGSSRPDLPNSERRPKRRSIDLESRKFLTESAGLLCAGILHVLGHKICTKSSEEIESRGV